MRPFPVLLCLITLILLGGCRPEGSLTFTEEDAGQTIRLAQGETFSVRLKANHTTAYRWFVDLPPDSVVGLDGEPTYVSESNALGAAGEQTWTFRALRSGTHTLRLEEKVTRDDVSLSQVAYTVEVQ